jgi:hypothetical protein
MRKEDQESTLLTAATYTDGGSAEVVRYADRPRTSTATLTMVVGQQPRETHANIRKSHSSTRSLANSLCRKG